MLVDYNQRANIPVLEVNGVQVINNREGIYTGIKTTQNTYSSLHLNSTPAVTISGHSVTIANIGYGDKNLQVKERWTFMLSADSIRFSIERNLSKAVTVEKLSFPAFVFNDINSWNGAYQDYGGIAWFYLFNKQNDTYGVHSSSSRFWNSQTGNGLGVAVHAPGSEVAMDYSRTTQDQLAYTIALSPHEMVPRFDAGTNRRRFLRDTITDVWASCGLPAGKSSATITLSYFNFKEQYGRGDLKGINGERVSAVLNTIARIGVIDRQHFGGNSWHTPYGPICLHEQYIAQMGLAINDPAYLQGYRDCLDFYRDNAIKPTGRVWPRWAYTNEDMMPGEVTGKGFYEAQWGYLLDANPDMVTNVAELYDQSGDLAWVKTHQASCEKALEWIMHRDSNHNGLVEMMTDSMGQKRGSDWIDIIWAAYENAFVNAKLYHALVLWAAIEKRLGNSTKAGYYQQFAALLKSSFNKPASEGGFWDEDRKCYVHWRDKNGSVHGNNMVTPVNFMAIGYGICDDDTRTRMILDGIETQMEKEQLFFWPICMYSYAPGEGNDWQFPFPNYENGDLFLSWGALGVKAYAGYKPELALKYVNNVLDQYAKDGLAFQRYGREKQDGRGDDILSGNSLSVVGLYQAIYGVNPLYNRFYLDPHITPALAGTMLNYRYRGQLLKIGLDMNRYSVSGKQFTITAAHDFGFSANGNELSFFDHHKEDASLTASCMVKSDLSLQIQEWTAETMSWQQSSTNKTATKIVYRLNDLQANTVYTIDTSEGTRKQLKSDDRGSLFFEYLNGSRPVSIKVSKG